MKQINRYIQKSIHPSTCIGVLFGGKCSQAHASSLLVHRCHWLGASKRFSVSWLQSAGGNGISSRPMKLQGVPNSSRVTTEFVLCGKFAGATFCRKRTSQNGWLRWWLQFQARITVKSRIRMLMPGVWQLHTPWAMQFLWPGWMWCSAAGTSGPAAWLDYRMIRMIIMIVFFMCLFCIKVFSIFWITWTTFSIWGLWWCNSDDLTCVHVTEQDCYVSPFPVV